MEKPHLQQNMAEVSEPKLLMRDASNREQTVNATSAMEESDPHAEAEPPTLGPQLCSSPSGPERLEQDVSKFLDAFIAGGQCDDVLRALPLFISKDGRSHSLHESEA